MLYSLNSELHMKKCGSQASISEEKHNLLVYKTAFPSKISRIILGPNREPCNDVSWKFLRNEIRVGDRRIQDRERGGREKERKKEKKKEKRESDRDRDRERETEKEKESEREREESEKEGEKEREKSERERERREKRERKKEKERKELEGRGYISLFILQTTCFPM